MRTLLILLAIGGAAYFGYHKIMDKSPAYVAYENFMTAMSKGNCPEMHSFCDGSSPAGDYVNKMCEKPSFTIYGVTTVGQSVADMVAEMHGTPLGATMNSARKKLSETESEDGAEVSLEVMEKVFFHPASGMTAAGPKKQNVKVKNFSGVWKVTEFAEAPAGQ